MSRIKALNFPLFWKFASVSIVVVLVFGSINILLLWSSVYKSFEKEIDKRCIVLSSIVAEKIFVPLVYENVVNIYSILDEVQKSDSSIAYIFILDGKGEMIAKTGDFEIPQDLIAANNVDMGKHHIKVIQAENYKHKVIRDIAYPILRGDLGSLRMGISEGDIRKELDESTNRLLIMIILFLLFGLGGALFFSHLITSPIKSISEKAQLINLDSIERETFEIEIPPYKKILNYYFKDELDVLVSKFNLMLIRLKDNVVQMKTARNAYVQTEKLASIGTLTSGIGHEINNPLSGIQNGINRILKDPNNIDQNTKYLELIKDATDKIERIVHQLLNFSRTQDVVFERINPIGLLKNSINLVEYKLEKNNIGLEIRFCAPFFIEASVNHMEQVFLNLFLNAIDAIEERKKTDLDFIGKITVTTEHVDNQALISISDNGIGMKIQIRNCIFDPFYTTKEVGKGTGLGLYVSYDIIKQHRGQLTFDSIYGAGTEFIIKLPIDNSI